MRDAAKRLVEADWRNLRGGYAERGLGERLVDRLSEGANDLAGDTRDFAEDHPATIGTGVAVAIAAAVGWMFRDEISDKLQEWWDRDWF
ncbi:hypothetical protein [Aurantiacibacter luteus]|nr:hypothetical protein [Aurantiacibacter luteus]